MRGKFEPIDIVEETTADLLESAVVVEEDKIDKHLVQSGTFHNY
jgi:hypothetical protein